ncbi:MAG: class I SAM-dependent methyltransferase [Gammaproteobacteria bacterium]
MVEDHFSQQSGLYARYRPRYPDTVFRWLAEQAPAQDCAWDSATGNGQAAIGLASHFDTVIATDLSTRQLSLATPHPAVRYVAAPSERAPIEDNNVDLVMVAQALHWFDLPKFFEEVRRVSRDGALLAVVSYGLFRVAPEIDTLIDHLYGGILGSDWPPERVHVDSAYADLPFPFPAIPAPRFELREHWNLDHLLGFLGSWSATVRHKARTGGDPLARIEAPLREAWGPAQGRHTIRWPLAVKAGHVRRDQTEPPARGRLYASG